MLLELLGKTENPRWTSGGHFEFPIGSEIKHDLYLKMIKLHTKNHFNISNVFQDIMSRNENPRWLPGGHIGLLIGSKTKLDLYIIMIHLHTENHFNISNSSPDIERKRKSNMAAWRPYWISNRLQN